MVIPSKVYKLIPKTTAEILEREIAKNNINLDRNWTDIYKRMNTYSRGNLTKIAYLNGETINQIIKKRVYSNPESVWASFRRSDYGPVMTRLAISSIEEDVTKKEVMDLMKRYESKGVIPEMQKVSKVIERAWYVASKTHEGMSAKEANNNFRQGNIDVDDVPVLIIIILWVVFSAIAAVVVEKLGCKGEGNWQLLVPLF